jgi:hypothetical protein
VTETVLFWVLLVCTGMVIILLVIKQRFPTLWKRLQKRFTSPPPRPRYSKAFPESTIKTSSEADPREVIRIVEEIRLREKSHDKSGRNLNRIEELRRRLEELQPDGKPDSPSPVASANHDGSSAEEPEASLNLQKNDSNWRLRQLEELDKRMQRPNGQSPSNDE